MAELKNKYVVEFSVRGGSTHIQTMQEMLEKNLRAVMEGRSNDYVPVAIADSPEAAMAQADVLEVELKKKQGQ